MYELAFTVFHVPGSGRPLCRGLRAVSRRTLSHRLRRPWGARTPSPRLFHTTPYRRPTQELERPLLEFASRTHRISGAVVSLAHEAGRRVRPDAAGVAPAQVIARWRELQPDVRQEAHEGRPDRAVHHREIVSPERASKRKGGRPFWPPARSTRNPSAQPRAGLAISWVTAPATSPEQSSDSWW